jgi:hypothetical protein
MRGAVVGDLVDGHVGGCAVIRSSSQ